MPELSVESMKQVNLVEFLAWQYGMEFRRSGSVYSCLSPFTNEREPSFFVRLVGGHWLFKDFSSGAAGTIFDFVQMKEKLGTFSEALKVVRELLSGLFWQMTSSHPDAVKPGHPYDVGELYQRFRQEDPQVCREYLLGRGIAAEIIDEMIADGTVVHNRYEGRSYCCFAVRDNGGQLRCLDNHAIEGAGKFVLGQKSVFTREWEAVKRSAVVFLCEGIIDYLSLKTLELSSTPGLALLGNQLCFEAALLERTEKVIAAVDADEGGTSAVLDLKELYPEKEVRVYDLEGYKDPNELLMAVRRGKGRQLSPEKKLELYREFQRTQNKTELARRWGLDRSHLYQIVRDCEETMLEAFSGRKPGRPRAGTPKTIGEALDRIKELEAQYEREAKAREEMYCRSELLALRLKWAEIEAAELRGEKVEEEQGPEKKPQIKKNEKHETVRKIEKLVELCRRLTRDRIMGLTCHSRSQLYKWLHGEYLERRGRERKKMHEETVENAVKLIAMFPHLGGRKGQAYLLYHQLGLIGMNAYDRTKVHVRHLLGQAVSQRKLLPAPISYEHIRPQQVGQIWAEDFTELAVEGHTFKLALLLDTFDQYYLGWAINFRASAALVGQPVTQALEQTGRPWPPAIPTQRQRRPVHQRRTRAAPYQRRDRPTPHSRMRPTVQRHRRGRYAPVQERVLQRLGMPET